MWVRVDRCDEERQLIFGTLTVPPTPIVPLSASLRQRGWVLGGARLHTRRDRSLPPVTAEPNEEPI